MALQDNGQEPEIGSPISTIGTPNSVELGQSVAKGIVSGFRVGNGISYIQTDISLNGGNSGGAFISKEGHVIGIAALKLVGEDVNGIGFGIPVSHVFSDLGLRYK
jgi:S1-C subfamily serine protease